MATTLFSDCIERFRVSLCDNQFPENTVRAYVGDVAGFASDSGMVTLPDLSLLETAMKRWLANNSAQWAPKTMNRKVTSLRRFLRHQGMAAPLTDLRLPKALRGKPHPLPGGKSDLLAMIRQAVTEDQRVLIAMCGLIGLRIGEALAAQAAHIDRGRMMFLVYGKGRVEREVPISPDAWTYIGPRYTRMWLAGETGLLVNMADRTARRIITDLGRGAGVSRPVASHDLRATFATEAYRKCRDINAVARLLGHSDTKTTMIYIESSADELHAAAAFGLEEDSHVDS